MADDKVKAAVDVIARSAVALAAYNDADDHNPSDFVHQADYDLVVAEMRKIAASMDPGTEAFEAAVEFLGTRKAGESNDA